MKEVDLQAYEEDDEEEEEEEEDEGRRRNVGRGGERG